MRTGDIIHLTLAVVSKCLGSVESKTKPWAGNSSSVATGNAYVSVVLSLSSPLPFLLVVICLIYFNIDEFLLDYAVNLDYAP